MKRYVQSLDTGSVVVLVVTVVFFGIALFEKGLTHDMLLEAGVFLVSVKLMMLSYKASVAAQSLARELAEIKALLARQAPEQPPADAPLGAGEQKG